MFLVENNGITDPYLNLAWEEYCLRSLDSRNDYLLLFINEPAVILGRSQNAFAEMDHQFVRRKGIHVVRRISGGGAVYHDLGNLNFSFITGFKKANLLNFRKFTAPIIKTLHDLGVPAELSGRNDIVAYGRKITGNAQYSSRKSMLTHGTLLFDTEMENLLGALNAKRDGIVSSGVPSVPRQVANISEFLDCSIGLEDLKSRLLDTVFKSLGGVRITNLNGRDWENIHRLADEKYRSWDWNYGKSPEFQTLRSVVFDSGCIDVHLEVKDGIIQKVQLRGDYYGCRIRENLEKALTGRRYDVNEIGQVLTSIDPGSPVF